MEPLGTEELVPEGVGLVSRSTRLADAPAPWTVLESATSPRTMWAAPGEATVIGGGAAATIEADGPERFEAVREAATELFSTGDVHAGAVEARPRLFGGFSFHDEHDPDGPWRGYAGARFVLPDVQVAYAEDGPWLTVNAVDDEPEAVAERLADVHESIERLDADWTVGDPPGVVDRERTTSRAAWHSGVTQALDRIEAGELRKVVLAQAMETRLDTTLSLPDALDRLGDSYPDCMRFLFEPAEGDGAFFGATPEKLVGLRGRTVETGALAGTTGRGDTPEEDDWLARELLEDAKNLHEHQLVADAIHEQLDPFASSIRSGVRAVRRLATVQHIETPITAELADDEHVLTLVEALHPTPAVGGLPPDDALRTIRDTEPFERGWYAAPVGWFDAAGSGSFAVAIRSALAEGADVTLFAGVGVVEDSEPEREWDEVQLKYRPIRHVLER